MFDIDSKPQRRCLSRATSPCKKKALFIALNYAHSSSPCFGNVQASTDLKDTMLLYGHYTDSKTLNDVTHSITRRHIIDALDWLLEDCDEGDVLFLNILGRGEAGLELCDGTFTCDNFIESLIYPLPHGVTLLIVSDIPMPLSCRFLCKDISEHTETPASKKHIKNMPVIKADPSVKRFEDRSKEECASVFCLYSGVATTGILSFLLNNLLLQTYPYSISLIGLLQSAQACMRVNKVNAEVSLECGQYIDLNVPLGRILHLPL